MGQRNDSRSSAARSPSCSRWCARILLATVAAVERTAHRREPGHAVVARRALLVAEELQDAAEVGLHQPVTGRRDLAARHPDRDVLRPVPHVVGVPAHVVEHDGVAGEAPGCVAHRARRHVAEGHRAPALQGLEAGIGGRAGTTVRRTPSGISPP